LFFSAILPSTIDPLVTSSKDPFIFLVSAVAKHQNRTDFAAIRVILAVDGDIRRLSHCMVACESLFFSAILPSTIDQVVTPPKDPFFMVVSAVAKHQNRTDFAWSLVSKRDEQYGSRSHLLAKTFYR